MLALATPSGGHNIGARWTKSYTEFVLFTADPVYLTTMTKPYRFFFLDGDVVDVGCWGIDGGLKRARLTYWRHLGCSIETETFTWNYRRQLHFYKVVVHPLDHEDLFVVTGAHEYDPLSEVP